MPLSVYTSATGLSAAQSFLDVTGNNLANTNTTAYKASAVSFQDLFYQNLGGPAPLASEEAAPVGVDAGAGVRLSNIAGLFTQGAIQPTGRELDLAIAGEGFFQVEQPDGTLAYTRDGAFTRDAAGGLVTADGMLLVPPVNIPEDASSVLIGEDGTVSALVPGSLTPVVIGQITLARFVNPAGLLRLGTSLFAETEASGAPQAGAPGAGGLGEVRQGALEGSNVEVTTELTNLLVAQRTFSFNSEAFRIGSEILRSAAQLVAVA